MKKHFLFAALMLCVFAGNIFAQKTNTSADAIVGIWLTSEGKAKVKVEKYGEKYSGKIIWLKEPISTTTGKPKTDVENPDVKQREKPLLGLNNLLGFKYKGKNVWEDGTIYDPKNGKTYDCVITLIDDNTLDVRGYVGFSLIGRTVVWTRVTEAKK